MFIKQITTKNFDGKKFQFVPNFRLSKNLGTYKSKTKESTRKDNLDSYQEQAHRLKQERRDRPQLVNIHYHKKNRVSNGEWTFHTKKVKNVQL